MAKDSVTIKNESLRSNEDHDSIDVSSKENDGNSLLDFQKKITLYKHEKQDGDNSSFSDHDQSYKQLLGMYLYYAKTLSVRLSWHGKKIKIIIIIIIKKNPSLVDWFLLFFVIFVQIVLIGT